MHTNPQTEGQTFSFWREEENLVFLITFERDIGSQQMRCHSTRILSKNKTSYLAGGLYPHRLQQLQFSKILLLHFHRFFSQTNLYFESLGMQDFDWCITRYDRTTMADFQFCGYI